MSVKEQIIELTNNPEFVAAGNQCKTEEEVRALFEQYDVSWDDFKAELKKDRPEGEIDDAELSQVVGGGGFCIFIGFGSTGFACSNNFGVAAGFGTYD